MNGVAERFPLFGIGPPLSQLDPIGFDALGILQPDGTAELIDGRGSGDIVAAGMSDGFVEVPPGFSNAILPYYTWPAGA